MGVRDALEYGGSAPQRDPAAPPAPASGAYSLIGELNTRPESEDCLVLNVWTPGLDDGAKRPVMFWMHGGGFQAGTGSSPGYDGARLAERGDVVVVTVNHRLNVLGFLWPDDEFDANPGMQDLLLALQWVRLNMAAFGGDPTRVLAFGESGGGRKVGTLLAMPEARGLFQRAAIQSGPTLRVLTRERAEQARRALCDELQLPAASLEALQAVPLDRLMAAYHAASRKHRFNHVTSGFAPVVIGEQLPAHPFEPRAAAVMPEVPVIAGTNQSEMTLMLAGDRAAFELDEQGLSERVNALLAEHAESVLQVYRDTLPDATPSQLYFAIASDRAYCARMMTLAERRSELRGAPVYFYYLTWHSPAMGGRLGAPHALDVPLVFDNVRRSALTGSSERAQALADKMSDAWIAFARSGEPQTDALPHWQPYTAPERATLVLDDECRMERDPTRERRIAMQRALGLL
jgi:para-nitrobenzyl esterase